MCDANLLGGLIIAASVALLVAATMLLVAIAQAQNIFTAFASVGYTLLTAAFIAVAVGCIGYAVGTVIGPCGVGPCGVAGSNVATALSAVLATLVILLAVVLVSALVPVAIVGTGPVALVTLLGAGGSLVYLGGLVVALSACLRGLGTPSAALDAAGYLAIIVGVYMAAVAVYGIIVTIQTSVASSSG